MGEACGAASPGRDVSAEPPLNPLEHSSSAPAEGRSEATHRACESGTAGEPGAAVSPAAPDDSRSRIEAAEAGVRTRERAPTADCDRGGCGARAEASSAAPVASAALSIALREAAIFPNKARPWPLSHPLPRAPHTCRFVLALPD